MKKPKVTTNFVCQECGYDTQKWLGKCPECGVWNSFKEFQTIKNSEIRTKNSRADLGDAKPQKLSEIAYQEKSRIGTNYKELDTVLGGGIVKGSVTLIAGDPGVGKSTLLLQLALSLARGSKGDKGDKRDKGNATSASSGSSVSSGLKVLYVSGEESAGQVKMRAERIKKSTTGTTSTKSTTSQEARDTRDTRDTRADNLLLLSQTNVDAIITQIEDIKPDLVVVDSIQTLESENTSGLAGSVAQIRYSALQLVRIAKQNNIPIIIVGHVTKDGMVAGPMILSHMVDTVLFLEGEKNEQTRILRSFKNRFGPVDEVGIFVMSDEGMSDADDPEKLFLTDEDIKTPGSVRVVTLEGSRAFVIEIQSLVVTTRLPMPRRVVSGLDGKRVELLLAVLQKHAKLPVDMMDVFVNVAGGLRVKDRAVDLGVCLAVYSSLKNKALPNVVGIAEVGLLGETRNVSNLDKRVKEAKKLGFKNIITAKTHKSLKDVIEGLEARG